MERGLTSTWPTGVMVLGHCWRVDAWIQCRFNVITEQVGRLLFGSWCFTIPQPGYFCFSVSLFCLAYYCITVLYDVWKNNCVCYVCPCGFLC